MQAPVVIYPDVEAVALNWLAQQFDARGQSVVCSRRVPSPRPRRLVAVTRTGGWPDTPVTEAAQLTVDCWGPDDPTALQLAQTARALLMSMVGGDTFSVTITRYEEFTGPVNYPDPLTSQSRYTFTCRLSVRGTPLPAK
jgi:hypothetical protein